MSEKFDWRRNEFQQIGTDYGSVEEVAAYDSRMRKMRDVDAENRAILDMLKLTKESAVLEIGMGTGAFTRAAAKVCSHVTALDVSEMMIDYASGRAREEGLDNIDFYHAGFLGFDYPAGAFDAAVSGLALHHLPDAWKMVALEKIYRALKPGGRFFLLDVVFDWGNGDPDAYFRGIVEAEKEARPNLCRHISREFSTLAWIMTGLLTRAGFVVESDVLSHGFLRNYCCRKA
ncbi:MAG: class I SAM-dependent methyltransferase [Lentisphaeria bacterium]|nr:class I SAM-dependent methyltransferase [Lentisphaeria bacterium]